MTIRRWAQRPDGSLSIEKGQGMGDPQTPPAGRNVGSLPKLGGLPNRALNSLRSRGLKPTLRMIRAYAEDALFELKYGVRTHRSVDLQDLDIVGDNRGSSYSYVPVKVLLFRDALNEFGIPAHGTFVDLGSGKGRALSLAALYGFRRVVGVEFAQELCSNAEHNVKKFRERTRSQFEVEVFNVDAARYPVADDDHVFFFYNPFGSEVLSQVLINILDSLHRNPRPIHVVYAHPTQRHLLDANPLWRLMGETTSGGIETVLHYQAA